MIGEIVTKLDNSFPKTLPLENIFITSDLFFLFKYAFIIPTFISLIALSDLTRFNVSEIASREDGKARQDRPRNKRYKGRYGNRPTT